jgi:hypothetical protein
MQLTGNAMVDSTAQMTGCLQGKVLRGTGAAGGTSRARWR